MSSKHCPPLLHLFNKYIKKLRGLLFAVSAFTGHSKILSTDDIAIVVFSKDRPVQLEALLRSAKKYFIGNCSWFVLWRASNNQYSLAYENIFSTISLPNISFLCETDFKQNLIDILRSSRHHGVMFMVDDIIFIDYFDASSFIGLDPFFKIASLRHWPGASYCQPKSIQCASPAFRLSGNIPWLQFSWRESIGDWSMPLSLDGHLFSCSEILELVEHIHFNAPNSLEQALGEFRYLYKYRMGLCMPMPIIRNFAFNRVQTENDDFPCGIWNSEWMLEKWLCGWQLNIEALAQLHANSCHVEVEPIFERRVP